MDKAIGHTPGPWKAVTTDAFGSITIEANGRSICDIIGTMPVDEANASLIAAALDMAEALSEFVSYGYIDLSNNHQEILDKCRAALKKAGVE